MQASAKLNTCIHTSAYIFAKIINVYYSTVLLYYNTYHTIISIHFQRYKCSPGILVSSKVRFIWIFAGVCWTGGVTWEWVRRNGDFRFFCSLYLPNLYIQGSNYYIVLCSPLVALEWYQNRWPWVTLNGHFALKSVSGSATNGFASPALGQNCSKTCRATHILSATKM